MVLLRIATLTLTAASAVFGADQALLSLLNPEAKVVGGMNVARTMSSPFGQFLLTKVNTDDPGFREFTTMTGFDPRSDLREVVFASSGEPQGGKHPGVMVARGVFNGPQILAAAKAKGAQTANHKGIEMIVNKGGSMAVIDGSLVIAGDEANVRAAIDRRAISALPATQVFRKASSLMNSYDAWMVSTAPVSRFAGAAPNKQVAGTMQSNALQGILETSGGITFDSVIAIEGEALTRSDRDAQALMDVAKFLMGMIQMNGSNNPQMKLIEPILNSMQLRTEASTVKFSMRVAEADLEQLIQSGKGTMKRAQRRP